MDVTVEPNDNFYVYSNGNWMKKNPIPSGYSSWNTFQVSDGGIIIYEPSYFIEVARLYSSRNQ